MSVKVDKPEEADVEQEDFEMSVLLKKYKELELTISELREIQGLIDRGPIYRLSCYFKDHLGTPLKSIEGLGAIAAAYSIEKQLEKLTLPPYKVFKFRIEDEPIIIADFYPEFLLEVETVEEYLDALVNFKGYIEQIQIADAKIDVGMFEDLPRTVPEEVKHFKELCANQN